MDDLQQILVNEHINALRREADEERQIRHRARDGDDSPGEATADGRPARVRLGRWLIGVGTAVAGTTGDAHGGAAGHTV